MATQWKTQLDRLMALGASYADVRYYPKHDSNTLVMMNGNLLAFQQSGQSGFGVRVLDQYVRTHLEG